MTKFWAILPVLLCSLAVQSMEAKIVKSTTVAASHVVTVELKEGTIKLSEVLEACPEMKNCKPGEWHADVVGKEVRLNGKPFRIRVFSYMLAPKVDKEQLYGTIGYTGKLKDVTVEKYVSNFKDWGQKVSSITYPVPGIECQSFGSRGATWDDTFYFSLVLREKLDGE